jgi:succinate-semialdehyde dehydrogenase / glutarate-semialdehyde dehydrogenase
VADADEAIELANGSAFGLGGVVYSKDPQRAQDVADRLDTWMVWINSPQGWAADLPFVNKKLVYTPVG